MKLLTVLFFALALMGSAFAGSDSFLPKNKLRIPVGVKLGDGGLTQAQFNAVIQKIETIYAPVVANMGGKLNIVRQWSNAEVNANADRDGKPGFWNVNMYGGLARHPEVTEDGFSLVLCHELGHHIGGAPKVSQLDMMWASNEGEADYFAALKCLRHVFLNDNNAMALRKMKMKLKSEVPDVLVKACAKAWTDKTERDICLRTGMAGVSVAALFAALDNLPLSKFDTPDKHVVKKTDDDHPETQCRLDTFYQGALCEKSMNEDVSQSDEVKGTCHAKTGQKIGLRPLCWFKPKK
jgi:hypothetical protein